MQPLKYILNEAGEREAVIVPIQQWEEMTQMPLPKKNKLTVEDLEKLREGLQGVYPDNYQDIVRAEWKREWEE